MTEKEEALVGEIKKDFAARQEARRPLELNWRLNMNFVIGNQFACISPKGDIDEIGKQFFWQEKEVFNHVAPILESRLSKLGNVRANAIVRPATPDDDDVNSARLATKLIEAVTATNDFGSLMSEANAWSEVTGTAFYKVVWDPDKGATLDAEQALKEGDVTISVCPPFEIYPENLALSDLDKQASIIHAKVFSTADVKRIWDKEVSGGDIRVFGLDNAAVAGGFGYAATVPTIKDENKHDSVVVIEKYTAPTKEQPLGRLTIVAGDTLLFDGNLPFVNGEDGTRGYPFAKQVCLTSLGNFFGTSVVERIIPVQRAYNTVKNRKHEFMNRLALGVLAVEDGSVDTDSLEEEGLPPGKVLVYRQGSTPPVMMSAGQVPTAFAQEEEKLLSEFVMISGVSEVTTYSQVPSSVASGSAISLLLEQDDTRIALTADSLRSAVKHIGKMIIRLMKQFALGTRLMRVTGENGEVEIDAFDANDLHSEDVVFDTVNEVDDSIAKRRGMVYDLLKLGLFTDENGVMNNRTKAKIFEMLGFGNWEEGRDVDEMHLKKAERENAQLEKGSATADVNDNHTLHIDEHVKLLVSAHAARNKAMQERIKSHINQHREYASLASGVSALQSQMIETAKGTEVEK